MKIKREKEKNYALKLNFFIDQISQFKIIPVQMSFL